MKIIDLRWP